MSVGGIVWQCEEAHAASLAVFDVAAACRDGQAIKVSPAREVFFVAMGDCACVLKIFHAPVLWDRLRLYFSASRALLEWNSMRRLAGIGLPVPQPLAVGSKGMTGYLLMRRLHEVRPLKEIASSPLDFSERRHLSAALAHILSTLHNHNVLHRDLHLGNFLLDNKGQVFLLDLHDVRFAWRTSRSARLRNLAMLGNAVTMYATTSDHLDFLRHYLAASPLFAGQPWRKCVEKARAAVEAYRLAFWRERLPRCLCRNKYFRAWSDGQSRHGMYRADWQEAKTALTSLPDLLRHGQPLKDSRSSLVLRTQYGILKQYRQKKRRNMLFDWWRGSRARRAWAAGFDCMNRGIPTAKPLCFAEERRGPLITTSYLLCEEILQAQTLYDYLKDLGYTSTGEIFVRKKKILEAVGRLLRTLHLRGLLHRDLKSSNFLVSEERLYLIDLDGMTWQKFFVHQRRHANLKRLLLSLRAIPGITRGDLWRVATSYLPYASRNELMPISHFF
jgi:serine/threonine protein kinase